MKELLKKYPGYFMSYQKSEKSPIYAYFRFPEKNERFAVTLTVKSPEIVKKAIEDKVIEKPQILKLKKIEQKFNNKNLSYYYLYNENNNKEDLKETASEIKKIIEKYPDYIKPVPSLFKNTEIDYEKLPLDKQLIENIKKFKNKLYRFYLNIMLEENKSLIIDDTSAYIRNLLEEKPKEMKNILEKNNKFYKIEKIHK